jgi:hypothetical protein
MSEKSLAKRKANLLTVYIEKNQCETCQPYNRPGWVINADQWVQCWECNPTPKRNGGKTLPLNLERGRRE